MVNGVVVFTGCQSGISAFELDGVHGDGGGVIVVEVEGSVIVCAGVVLFLGLVMV